MNSYDKDNKEKETDPKKSMFNRKNTIFQKLRYESLLFQWT